MRSNAILAAAAALLLAPALAFGGTYYVDYGGTGAGTGWGDAYGSIQNALDAINTAGDSSATIKVGLTTGGDYYGASSKTFSYAGGTSATIGILGGYDPNTDTVTGVSNIGGSGAGLGLMVSGGSGGSPNVIDFTVRDFDIQTSAQAIYQTGSTNNSNYVNFNVYDSALSTTSTSANVIYTYSNGGQHASVLLDNTSVSTAAGSVAAAYYGRTSNASAAGTTEIRNGSTVTAQTDNSGDGKRGAIESNGNQLVVTGSTTSITNTGAGWGAYAGRTAYGPYGHNITDATITSTGGAGTGAVRLIANDFYSSTDGPTTIENATISTSDGQYGLHTDYAGGSAPSGGEDIVIRNSEITADGVGGVGYYNTPSGYTAGSDVGIYDSEIHGTEQAVVSDGAGHYANDTLRVERSILSAGDTDGSTNSSSVVVELSGRYSARLYLDRALIRNGAGGVAVDSDGPVYATLTNSVITDQTGTGVALDPSGNDNQQLTATNSTFSDLGGPAIVFADNGSGSTLEAILNYVAFVMGDGTETIFENLDANRQLTLTGDHNAFYEYLTYFADTGGGGLNDLLTNSLDAPAGDAMLAADGIHLLAGSPLIDQYTPTGGDPLVDYDGEVRPDVTLADIGADEAAPVPEPATAVLLGLGGLMGLTGMLRRRRR